MKKFLSVCVLIAAHAAFAFSQPVAVPGAALAEQLYWLRTNAASNTHYLIEIRGNEEIASRILTLPRNRGNVSVTLRGSGLAQAISLYGTGSLFTVTSGLTLILDNITLQGSSENNTNLIQVNNGAALIMKAGSVISANTGGAVLIHSGGTFTMYGGAILDNTGSAGGEGRHAIRGGLGGTGAVTNWGAFTMHDGVISNNAGGPGGDLEGARGGAGAVSNWRTFTMHGGTISGNSGGSGEIAGSGAVFNAGVFAMYGGTISGNSGGSGSANFWGIRGGIGGVNNSGEFILHDGEISGNSGGAGGNNGWGGVGAVSNTGRFTMNGGTISGNSGGSGSANSPWDGWGSVGAVFNAGAFTMHGGTIANNAGGIANWSVRHGTTSYGIFRITGGTIYGTDAAADLGNSGGTLRIFGVATTAQFGTFNNVGLFVSSGILANTDNTIHVAGGLLRE